MSKRAEQREQTRERIVAAAVAAFAELGFRGASTREIAARAGANQGLITYHFRTKDELWRAAADRIFGELRSRFAEHFRGWTGDDPRERAREEIREFVRFAAGHPELFHFLLDEGKNSDERMRWLVDTHLKAFYDAFLRSSRVAGPDGDPSLLPHAYYLLAGGGSVIFAVAPECRRLTGLEPDDAKVVEAHAEYLAALLVP